MTHPDFIMRLNKHYKSTTSWTKLDKIRLKQDYKSSVTGVNARMRRLLHKLTWFEGLRKFLGPLGLQANGYQGVAESGWSGGGSPQKPQNAFKRFAKNRWKSNFQLIFQKILPIAELFLKFAHKDITTLPKTILYKRFVGRVGDKDAGELFDFYWHVGLYFSVGEGWA